MSSIERLHWQLGSRPGVRPVRLALAVMLHAASRGLARLSSGLLERPRLPPSDPLIEFHAEAGAPEGALYVDGKLVGWLPGVRRL